MANPSGSCCCGPNPVQGCHCNPAMPWTSCRVTISGVTDPGGPTGWFCWNTYTHFNGTVWATKKQDLLPQFDGISSTNLIGCYDPNFQFTRYTLRVLPGISCLVQNDPAPAGSATYFVNCRVELTYYFLGLVDPVHNVYKEIALPPVVIGVAQGVSKVITCGTNPTFSGSIAPSSGGLGTPIIVTGTIEMAFQ